ncbi:amidohydrolase family protein [Arthrobacter citreus]|nr:amidohydrolase family protein [Arthrobacter citreus]
MYPKIDFHAHYLSPGYQKYLAEKYHDVADGVKTPKWSVDDNLEWMQQLNIEYAILSISSPHINTGEKNSTIELASEVNEFASNFQSKYPGKLGFFASLPLPYIEESVQTIDKAINEQNAIGFTLPTNSQGLYIGDRRLDPVMKKLNEQNALVTIHPNEPNLLNPTVNKYTAPPLMEYFFDTTRTIVNMAENTIFSRYPKITWIIPHGGSLLPIIAQRIAIGRTVLGHESHKQDDILDVMNNMYFDTAGAILPYQLPTLLKMVDSNKILYGSDTPYTPTNAALAIGKDVDASLLLSESFKQNMYHSNGAKLLNSQRKREYLMV